MAKPLILVGGPCLDDVKADFAYSLATLCRDTAFDIRLCNYRCSIVAMGRNECVATAKRLGCTHLFFVDSDMVFPSCALDILMGHQKEIVGATYCYRNFPFAPIGIPDGKIVQPGDSLWPLQKMSVIPTGCLLIDMKVFEDIPDPPFNYAMKDGQLVGEDIYFCDEARKAGFELWCDIVLSKDLYHIGQRSVNIRDWQEAQQMGSPASNLSPNAVPEYLLKLRQDNPASPSRTSRR